MDRNRNLCVVAGIGIAIVASVFWLSSIGSGHALKPDVDLARLPQRIRYLVETTPWGERGSQTEIVSFQRIENDWIAVRAQYRLRDTLHTFSVVFHRSDGDWTWADFNRLPAVVNSKLEQVRRGWVR